MADAEKLLNYLKTTAGETEYTLNYPDEVNFTIEDEENFISHYTDDKGSILISAFDGDKLIGNASLTCVMNRKKTQHRATFGIAILKSEWGQGLGEKLICLLIDFAKKVGYGSLELEVASDNIAAIRLYEKLGFVVYGERPCAQKRKNGDCCGELLMILNLK